jgi:molecular chaperone GrpE
VTQHTDQTPGPDREVRPGEAGGAEEALGPRPDAPVEEAVEQTVAAEEYAAAVDERDRYLDALQRLKAEFDNYRKRNERERQNVIAGAARDVIAGLLPVMDNLERAVVALEAHDEGVVAGIDMVRGQLAGLLAGHGVEEIPAAGHPFDPTVHEAIAAVPSHDHAEGTVIEVVEKGYRHSDHVLRPTRVVIAAPPPGQ